MSGKKKINKTNPLAPLSGGKKKSSTKSKKTTKKVATKKVAKKTVAKKTSSKAVAKNPHHKAGHGAKKDIPGTPPAPPLSGGR